MVVDPQLLTASLTIMAIFVLIFRIASMTKETQSLVANQHICLAGCLFGSLFVPAAWIPPLIVAGLVVFFWASNHRWKFKAPEDTLRPSQDH